MSVMQCECEGKGEYFVEMYLMVLTLFYYLVN